MVSLHPVSWSEREVGYKSLFPESKFLEKFIKSCLRRCYI